MFCSLPKSMQLTWKSDLGKYLCSACLPVLGCFQPWAYKCYVLAYFLYLWVITLSSTTWGKTKCTSKWMHLCKIHKLLWTSLPSCVCKGWEFSSNQEATKLLKHTNNHGFYWAPMLPLIGTSGKNKPNQPTNYSSHHCAKVFSVSSWLLKSGVIPFPAVMRPFGARWNSADFQILMRVFVLNLIFTVLKSVPVQNIEGRKELRLPLTRGSGD